jgi:hypothetical protein
MPNLLLNTLLAEVVGPIQESFPSLEPTPTAFGGAPSIGGDLLGSRPCQRDWHNNEDENLFPL